MLKLRGEHSVPQQGQAVHEHLHEPRVSARVHVLRREDHVDAEVPGAKPRERRRRDAGADEEGRLSHLASVRHLGQSAKAAMKIFTG